MKTYITGLIGVLFALQLFAGNTAGTVATFDFRDYTLTVSSEVGSPFPGVGTHVYAWGASVGELSAGSRLIEVDGSVFECSGWTGSGLVPSVGNQGKFRGFLFDGTTESSVTWSWGHTDDVVVRSVTSDVVGSGSHVTFLEGVPVSQMFHADVDWNGHPPGLIRFVREGSIVQQSSTPNCSINLKDFKKGEKLYVYAIAADGAVSEKRVADFSVISIPTFVSSLSMGGVDLFSVELERGILTYRLTAPLGVSFFEETKKIPAGILGKSATNVETIGMDVSAELTGSISSDGTMAMAMKYNPKKKWKAFGMELKPSIAGKVLGKYQDSGDWMIGGEARFDVAAAFESPPLYLHPTPPIYGRIKVEGSAGAGGSIAWDQSQEQPFQWKVVVPFEFVVSLIAGIGVADVVSVNGSLGGGVGGTMEFFKDPVLQELYLKWIFSLKIEVSIMEWTLVERSGTHNLLSPTNAGLLSMALSSELNETLRDPSRADSVMISRNYRARKPLRMNSASGASSNSTVVASSVFPNSDPSMVEAASSVHLLWLRDDGLRSDANRLVLSEQVRALDGGAWSSPNPVWDDGTLDASPEVAGNAAVRVAAWQNAKAVLADDVSLEALLAGQEIAVAVWSGSEWVATNVTDNAVFDRTPNVAVGTNGSAMVTWVRNAGGSLIGDASKPNSVLFSIYEGAGWSEPQPVATNLPMMLWSDFAFSGDRGFWVGCFDADDDQATEEDQELYGSVWDGASWGELSRLTENEVQDSNPQVSYDENEDLIVTWIQDGTFMLAQTETLADAVDCKAVSLTSAAVDYKQLNGNGSVGMVWEMFDDSGEQQPHSIVFDRTLNGWSDPFALLNEGEHLERAFDGLYASNGTLILAYNRVLFLDDTNGVPQPGQVDLAVLDYTFETDLGFVSEITGSPEAWAVGESVELQATLQNYGAVGVTNFNVAFYDGDPMDGGVLIGTEWIESIFGGEKKRVTQSWTVTRRSSPVDIYVVIDPELAISDANRSNNSIHRAFVGTQPTFGSLQISSLSNQTYQFEFSLENDGYSDCTNSWTVRFYDASETMIHQMQSSAGIAAESNVISSASWADDSNVWTNATETLNAYLLIGSDTSVVDQISAQFDTALDSDFDWISDADELRFGTDPSLLDTDGDGLDDRFELLQFESSAILADTDGDGYGDYQEYIAGTSSTNASSLFTIDLQGGLLSVPTMTNRTYAVEYTDTLGDEWHSLTNFSGTGGTINVQRGSETNSRFYRVNVQFE